MNNLPEIEAREIFNTYLEAFGVKNIITAKRASLICGKIFKDKSSTTTEKYYWSAVIKVIASY
jgi:hypothetical protein